MNIFGYKTAVLYYRFSPIVNSPYFWTIYSESSIWRYFCKNTSDPIIKAMISIIVMIEMIERNTSLDLLKMSSCMRSKAEILSSRYVSSSIRMYHFQKIFFCSVYRHVLTLGLQKNARRIKSRITGVISRKKITRARNCKFLKMSVDSNPKSSKLSLMIYSFRSIPIFSSTISKVSSIDSILNVAI